MARKGLSSFTTTEQNNIVINYKLYDTIIVKIINNKMILNSGGWQTKHTKNCINDVLPFGHVIFQKDFSWFVSLPKNVTINFTDNMIIILN